MKANNLYNELCDLLGIEPARAKRIGFKTMHLKDILRTRDRVQMAKIKY